MISKFKKAVFSALSFYEVFSYPLTVEEIWHNLLFYNIEDYCSFTRKDLQNFLDELKDKDLVSSYFGLYSIKKYKNKLAFLDQRRKYYVNYYQKLQKAKKWAKRLAKFPGIKMVAVVNSVAMKIPKSNSDLDFLIVTKHRYLWISRFLVTMMLKVFGLRPKFKENDKDAICTSFWLSEKSLDLEKIKIQDFDIYLFYWLLSVIPLYDKENCYFEFQQANLWNYKNLPKGNFIYNQDLLVKINMFSKFCKKFLEILLYPTFIFKILKKIQIKLFAKKIKDLMNKDSRVIVNDQMLKFHTIDNRKKYFLHYKENFDKLLKKYEYV